MNAYSIVNGVGSQSINGPQVALGLSNYLRVNKTGNTYKLEYGTNGISWITVGSLTKTITVSQVGLYVMTATNNPATIANFDYFK